MSEAQVQPGPVVEEPSGDGGLGAVEVLALLLGLFAGLPSALYLAWRLRRHPAAA